MITTINNIAINPVEVCYYYAIDLTLFIGRKNKFDIVTSFGAEIQLEAALNQLDEAFSTTITNIQGSRLIGNKIQSFDKIVNTSYYLEIFFYTGKTLFFEYGSEGDLNTAFNNLVTFVNESAQGNNPEDTFFVSPGYAGLSAPYYATLQEVLDVEAAGTKLVKVYPAASYEITGAVDDINISCEDRQQQIIESAGTVNANSYIDRAELVLGAGENGGFATSRTWQYRKLFDCTVYHFRDLLIQGGEMKGVVFIAPDGVKVTFDKDSNDKYCNVINCTSRTAAEFAAGYTGAMIIEQVPGLEVITDPTL